MEMFGLVNQLKHYCSIVEYLCRYVLTLPQYEEYLCRYDLTLPQYEEYLCRYDVEERRQSWKLIRVGDFKDK